MSDDNIQDKIDEEAKRVDEETNKKIEKFIKKNENKPEKLKHLLLEMPLWKTPDLKIVKKLLSLGVSVNSRVNGNIILGTCGASVLVDAAGRGHTEFVELLLDNGADIESESPWDGRTALMDASLHGHVSTVELLISRKANVNAIGYEGVTALIWAAAHSHIKVVKLLFEAGADINHKNKEGQTALDKAKEEANIFTHISYIDVIKFLKEISKNYEESINLN